MGRFEIEERVKGADKFDEVIRVSASLVRFYALGLPIFDYSPPFIRLIILVSRL